MTRALQARCRTWADYCAERHNAAATGSIKLWFSKMPELVCRLASGFIAGLVSGYVSHLALDAGVDRCLTFVKIWMPLRGAIAVLQTIYASAFDGLLGLREVARDAPTKYCTESALSVNAPFVKRAADILADTDFGLSGGKIASECAGYAVAWGLDIRHASRPFGAGVPNKRTALNEILLKLSEQSHHVIDSSMAL